MGIEWILIGWLYAVGIGVSGAFETALRQLSGGPGGATERFLYRFIPFIWPVAYPIAAILAIFWGERRSHGNG